MKDKQLKPMPKFSDKELNPLKLSQVTMQKRNTNNSVETKMQSTKYGTKMKIKTTSPVKGRDLRNSPGTLAPLAKPKKSVSQ